MKSWWKTSSQAGLILLLIFLHWGCGSFTEPPEIYSISPNPLLRGQQNVQVTIQGVHFLSVNGTSPGVVVDDGDANGVTGSVVSFDESHIVVNLSVSSSAALGSHHITVYTFSTGPGSSYFEVQCNPPSSCSPPPTLQAGLPDILVGQSIQATVRGHNFAGNSPALELDFNLPDLIISPPGPVYQSEGMDAFDVSMSASTVANTGVRRMRVVTSAGRTEWQAFEIIWQLQIDTPPGTIFLTDVRPDRVAPGGDVYIECHGKGFGTNREVMLDPVPAPGNPDPPPIPITTYAAVNNEGDPDSIVVAKIHPDVACIVRVKVKNLDTNLTTSETDDIRIFVTHPNSRAPSAINNATDGVHRGGSYTLQVTGQNLSELSNSSWTGVAGLTFSNTNPSANAASVTVTADMTAPLSGNQATNLTISHGRSLPFPINILPPIP
jgi:hypothetical protein